MSVSVPSHPRPGEPQEPEASLPTLLASDDLADLVPTVVRVIGECGRVWKIRTDAELRYYVDVNPTERAAAIAGLDDAFERWARRLAAAR